MDEREAMFQSMVSEFPDSPMGHFSLGKYFLEKGRFGESAAALAKAVALDPNYAAAWVALGDARAAAGDSPGAKDAWQRALDTPHGKRDLSLQSDLEQRMQDLS
jgi:predicted Zn-dependent protease